MATKKSNFFKVTKPKKYKPKVYKQSLSDGTVRKTNSKTGKSRVYKKK